MSQRDTTSTIGLILAATAATAATLMLALVPAWVPPQAHDGLRVVELPRVVVIAERHQPVAQRVIELPRVVISAKREAPPASVSAEAGTLHQARPVMSRQPG